VAALRFMWPTWASLMSCGQPNEILCTQCNIHLLQVGVYGRPQLHGRQTPTSSSNSCSSSLSSPAADQETGKQHTSMLNIHRSSTGTLPVMTRRSEVGSGRRAIMSKLVPEAPLSLGKPPIHGMPSRSHGLITSKQRRLSDHDLSARKAKRLMGTSGLPSCSGPGSISRRGPVTASYRHSTTPLLPSPQHPVPTNDALPDAVAVAAGACQVHSSPSPSITASPIGGVVLTSASSAPARSTSVTRSANGSVRSQVGPCIRSEGRPILVLDLDETLIHTVTSVSSLVRPCTPRSEDCKEMIMSLFCLCLTPTRYMPPLPQQVNGKTAQVLCRPGLDPFLSRVSKVFDVVVFTAGTKMVSGRR
jgi:hypothetical protein